MDKSKISVDCDVKSCIYNKNGTNCLKNDIKISGNGEKEHFCSSFEKIAGFCKK